MAQKFFSNVNFVDSVDVSWGTDEDFTIYHISGDNYITNDMVIYILDKERTIKTCCFKMTMDQVM